MAESNTKALPVKNQRKMGSSTNDETGPVRDGAASGDHNAAASVGSGAPGDTDRHAYLNVGDHIVVFPGNESCSDDTYDKTADDDYTEPEEVRFGHKARERIVEMWNRAKSSRLCWIALGCGLTMVISIVTAAILEPHLLRGEKATESLKTTTATTSTVALPTDAMTLPTHIVALPTSAMIFPSTNVSLTTTTETLPATAMTLPTTAMTLPTAVVTLPTTTETLPTTTETLPTTTETLPTTTETLPTTTETMSTTTETFLATTKTLPPLRAYQQLSNRVRCETGWHKYDSHCYVFMEQEVSWTDGHNICMQNGAHLVSIRNFMENMFIRSLIPSGITKIVWIGLENVHKNKDWWTDGSRLSYTNWAPDEPNNDHVASWFEGENCGSMFSRTGKTFLFGLFGPVKERGQWNDADCDHLYPFICKKPM
ncbi:uncharacterized protein LOC144883770 isoform X1 [Branchiostoma floridae x Branchiostoma japonicum]